MEKKQFILSILGIIILMAILFSASFLPDTNKVSSNPEAKAEVKIPNQIGSYILVSKLDGDEAKQQISHLHGKDIKIQNGYILEYQNIDQKSAIVWISESPSINDAKQLFTKMNELMDKSKMYTDHRTIEIDGLTLEYVFGMDMDNYYYQKGQLVIWIAAPVDQTQDFIKSGLKAF
jgi:hypothetical protein